MIIPSIDLMNGKAVQLKQGKEKILEREDVIELAKEFSMYGEIAVIDLDAALGKGNNLDLIKETCKIADCRVGGGIRTLGKAREFFKFGAKKIIIGTKATPKFLSKLPKDRLIAAIDTKNDEVQKEGWTKGIGKTAKQVINELDQYVSEYLFTNVDIEGTLSGIDLEKIKRVVKLTNNKITIAGGISSVEDIRQIEILGCNSQIGMAIYTGKIDLNDAFSGVLDFDKNKGLIPTIVQDVSGQVLMMAFSNKESIRLTFETKKATYFSRSRKKIWTKGETSGNTQKFIKARYDCDRDTLLYTVKQKNVACHLGSYSCFDDKRFSLNDLYDIILDRFQNPKEESYTSKILRNEDEIKKKINEESQEVMHYKDRDNLVWEIADLAYFVTCLMVKNNICMQEIKNMLSSRNK